MSKIEVNAIEPQSGTTLTIGASGDTVVLATGATSSGFGATYNGTVNWSSTIYSTNFTAVSGVGYFCDTTTAAFTVTLPASPAFGDIVAVKDWSSTSAINNITIARNGNLIEGNTTDAKIANHGAATTLVYSGASRGWMVTDSGDTQDLQIPQFVAATGGTVLTCGNYKTHVFTGPGSFVVSSGGNDAGSNSVEYLVVAGGGSGGRYTSAGGGAGGFRQNYPSPAFAGLPVTATTYPITVGAGGSSVGPAGVAPPGGTVLNGNRGSSSIFSTITSTGGGGGGGCFSGIGPSFPSVGPGGSGGGGGRGNPSTGGTGNTPPVSPSQGNNGGGSGGPCSAGGGGGGAGAVGTTGTSGSPGPGSSRSGGAGGVGSYWPNPAFGPTAPSYGTPGPVADTRYFAGGGAGGTYDANPGSTIPGGAGGGGPAFGTTQGGPSGALAGTAGTANTGGGGGSCSTSQGWTNTPGAGGSGIVVIRYKYQ
jgi:hypothetical protein